PRQSFAAVAFLGDDSTQKNRYGCILKLEGAWRAASRICSRSTCGISTGSKALTARLWKSASRVSLMGTPLCCYYNIYVLQTQHTNAMPALRLGLYCGTQKTIPGQKSASGKHAGKFSSCTPTPRPDDICHGAFMMIS